MLWEPFSGSRNNVVCNADWGVVRLTSMGKATLTAQSVDVYDGIIPVIAHIKRRTVEFMKHAMGWGTNSL